MFIFDRFRKPKEDPVPEEQLDLAAAAERLKELDDALRFNRDRQEVVTQAKMSGRASDKFANKEMESLSMQETDLMTARNSLAALLDKTYGLK